MCCPQPWCPHTLDRHLKSPKLIASGVVFGVRINLGTAKRKIVWLGFVAHDNDKKDCFPSLSRSFEPSKIMAGRFLSGLLIWRLVRQ